jgi:hypothetical protein
LPLFDSYPLKYDGTFTYWSDKNSPVYADGEPWWNEATGIIWSTSRNDVYSSDLNVFIKTSDKTLWFEP